MEEKTSGPKISKLNDELLKKDRELDDKPKRNSKESIIDKICQLAEENNLELNVSNTKLKRMSKEKLQQMLGEMIEDVVKKNNTVPDWTKINFAKPVEKAVKKVIKEEKSLESRRRNIILYGVHDLDDFNEIFLVLDVDPKDAIIRKFFLGNGSEKPVKVCPKTEEAVQP